MISEILYDARYEVLRYLDEHPDCERRIELEDLCAEMEELEAALEEA